MAAPAFDPAAYSRFVAFEAMQRSAGLHGSGVVGPPGAETREAAGDKRPRGKISCFTCGGDHMTRDCPNITPHDGLIKKITQAQDFLRGEAERNAGWDPEKRSLFDALGECKKTALELYPDSGGQRAADDIPMLVPCPKKK
jgi:hypothetical protein